MLGFRAFPRKRLNAPERPGGPVTLKRMLRALAEGELFGEVWGAVPSRVVALHGWRRSHADFSAALGPGAADGPLSTVAPDLPGFGATPAPSQVWGSTDYAAAVARLIEAVDGPLGPVVVVGHSLGGRVAVALASSRPKLVRGMLLTGAPLLRSGASSRSPARFRLARTLNRMGLLGDDRMELARRRHGSPDYRLAEGVMRQVLVKLVNEDYTAMLESLRCPVELVWGEQDSEAPVAVARGICERVPQASLTVCPGVGHLTPLECPHELRAAVERLLETE